MCGFMLDAGSHLTLLEFEIVQKSREIVQTEIAFSTPPPFQTLNRSKMVFGRFLNPKTYVVAGVQKCRNRSTIIRKKKGG
jgi:hypothetical protein